MIIIISVLNGDRMFAVCMKQVSSASGGMLFFFWARTHLSCRTYMEADRAMKELLDRLQPVGILTSRDNISETVLQKGLRGVTVTDT